MSASIEPVAWMFDEEGFTTEPDQGGTPLYTSDQLAAVVRQRDELLAPTFAKENRMFDALKTACDALTIAQAFCNSLSAEDCPDKVAIRINEALINVQKTIQSDEAFRCVGVIDSEGWIYPEPPEAGTQIFVKASSVVPTVAAIAKVQP